MSSPIRRSPTVVVCLGLTGVALVLFAFVPRRQQAATALASSSASSNPRLASATSGANESPLVPFVSITVNSTSDVANGTDGLCTLREAITAANTDTASGAIAGECVAGSGNDTISFTVTGTITLLTSLPFVDSNMSINGPGSNLLTIARSSAGGTPQFRVFYVNAVVNISGVTVTNGATSVSDPYGAGISNAATLTLTDVIVSGNTAAEGSLGGGVGGAGGNGGGIYNNSGILTMTSCVVSGNTAGQGGVAAVAGGPGGSGGGIHNIGTLIMTDCSVTGNNAGRGGNGVDFGGNGGPGGGIYNSFDASVSMTNCTVSGNNAGSSGVDGGNGGHGGGISTFGGLNTLTGVTLSNNSAGDAANAGVGGNGGAIHIEGQAAVRLINSTVKGNQSGSSTSGTPGWGGGISNQVGLFVSGSTIDSNTTESVGGGIANRMSSAVLDITNSTVSGNQASGSGAGIYDDAAVMKMTNCTVTNHASIGFSTFGPHTRTVRSSIIAGNGTDLEGSFTSQGNNLIGKSDGTNGFTNGSNGDQVGTVAAPLDPRLGFLANNGGPTETHALLAGSSAIDTGNNCVLTDTCSPALGFSLTTDQRGAGFARSIDGDGDGAATVDIGAYEVQAILVTNTNDSGPGSLRQAITDVNTSAGADAINFQAGLTGTIDLETVLPDLSTSMSINGPGPGLLTVRRSTAGGTPDFRIFTINSGNNVFISGLTISNGISDRGAGISNNGNLIVSNSIISGNSASNWGGGIYNDTVATLSVTRSTISGNFAPSAVGGGIANFGALTVVESTIAGNTATGTGSGGGIWSYSDSTLTVTNSTIIGNSAGSNGGGIFSYAALILANTTISGNTATGGGGGLITGGTPPTATLINVTITDNHASSNGGGALLLNGNDKLRNTIVAGNFSGSGTSTPDDIFGVMDTSANSSNNLIGTGGSGGLIDNTNGNRVGVANPGLGPLANNGGPTQTHALLADSIAIDAGNNCILTDTCSTSLGLSLTTDQRGAGFARSIDGDGNGASTVDIGAYEVQVILVTNTDDSGPGSLRQAITDANVNADTNAINFQAGLTGTITIFSELPLLATSMMLNGPGANLMTVARSFAASDFHIFTIYSGPSNVDVVVTISGLTMTGGRDFFAGGIQNLGTLTVNNSAIINNTSTGGGGGITSGGGGSFGSLTLNNCTVANNIAVQSGGGINSGRPLTIINSTISGNRTDLHGGGIVTGSEPLTIINSTITNNRSDFNNDTFGAGGGMSQSGGGTRILHNTIVAGNFVGTGSTINDVDLSLSPTSSFNLIGNGSGMTGISNGNNGNQVGTPQAPIDPKLGPLGNNGGPTLTHALLLGSPALDAGSNALSDAASLTTDQRGAGFIRKADSADANTTQTVDIGAFEARASVEDITDKATPKDTLLSFGFNVGDGALITSVTASSSNTTLVPNLAANINVTGSGSTRTLNITPAANQSGTSTITVTVTSGSESMSDTFVLTVTAPDMSVAVSPSAAAEDGATNLVYTFTRNDATGPLTVNFSVGGTATFNTDYTQTGVATFTASSGTVTFAAGSATKTLTIDPTSDTTDEPNETVILTVTSGVGYNVGSPVAATGTINDDDPAPAISINNVTQNEGNSGTTAFTFTVTLSNASSGTVTVNYATQNDSALAPGDYAAISPAQTLTFVPGDTSEQFTVQVNGDTTVEANEAFFANLSNNSANSTIADNQGVGTITNDDTDVTVAVSPSATAEDGAPNLVYTFTRTGVTAGALTVNFSVGGTAAFSTDYTQTGAATFGATSGTVTFGAGNATAMVTLNPTSDTTVESNETAIVTVTSGTGYNVASPSAATGTITNDDTEVTVAVAPSSVAEDGAPNLVYTFTRAGVTTGALTVNFSVGGTAGFGTDYTQTGAATFAATSGTVTFGVGNTTATVTINPTSDPTVETNETGILTVTSGTGYNVASPSAATGTITNDDTEVTVAVSPASVSEDGATNLVYTFTRAGVTSGALTVNFSASGTASSSTDYVLSGATTFAANSGTVTLAAASSSATVTVNPSTDLTFEPDETVILTVTSGTGYSVGSPSQATGTITNDDAAGGIIRFSSASYNTTESSGSTTITVERTGDTTQAVTVDYATPDDSEATTVVECSTNGQASPRCDFTTALGTLRFAAGETLKTFTVLISQDNYVEGAETLTLTLSNPTGGAVFGVPSTATLTIADDASEPATSPIDDVANFVRQHYLDFLNREPDAAGLAFWTNQITSCGADAQCIEVRRIHVSASFFLSIEFQDTGYLVERLYKSSYGDAVGNSTIGVPHTLPVPIVKFSEFLPDTQKLAQGVIVGQPGWELVLENNKQAFVAEFVQRPRFATAYPTTLTPAAFVDALFGHAGVTPTSTDRTAAISEFGVALNTADLAARGRALRKVAENSTLTANEVNRAFVLMQFFGYLRRNPNAAQDTDHSGYDFWLTKLNQFNGNFITAEMVKAFLSSIEYRHRFAP